MLQEKTVAVSIANEQGREAKAEAELPVMNLPSSGDSETQTERAISALQRELAKVSGIVRVEVSQDRRTSEKIIRVTVADLFDSSAWEATKLRSRILHDFPDALICIEINDAFSK